MDSIITSLVTRFEKEITSHSKVEFFTHSEEFFGKKKRNLQFAFSDKY